MTLTVIGVASLIDGLGFGDQLLRNFAIVVLALFGVSMLVPAIGRALERPLARLSRYGGRWNITPESATAQRGAVLTATVQAQKVALRA
jgi:hypothetical protein